MEAQVYNVDILLKATLNSYMIWVAALLENSKSRGLQTSKSQRIFYMD